MKGEVIEMEKVLKVGPLSMEKTKLKKNSLAGEVAVITGGTGNVGLGTARSLAWLGARVVLVDIDPELGKQAEAIINNENKPGTALFMLADVASESEMKTMADKVFNTFGKADILVNTAMNMSLGAPILKSTIEQFKRQLDISALGTLIGIQLFVPGMQKRHHGIVTYMSTAFRYPAGPSNYCAAKTAATSVMMSLAEELGSVKESGVSVFTFLPAGVGLPRSGSPRPADEPPSFVLPPAMPGYDGMIPPEDGGAALAYCITRANELHASGVTIEHAFRQMDWPYPKPETVRNTDYQRIDDLVFSVMFAFMGPGFPDPKVPLMPINRK
jgi:NAD(P)-dependent dehydrogenase (short-subunit alcohol dehydrogenase family)